MCKSYFISASDLHFKSTSTKYIPLQFGLVAPPTTCSQFNLAHISVPISSAIAPKLRSESASDVGLSDPGTRSEYMAAVSQHHFILSDGRSYQIEHIVMVFSSTINREKSL